MNNGRSKSGLFLIELLIVITVFALCAAICVRIFTSAYLAGTNSRDVSRALNVAKSAAEAFKATGDLAETGRMVNDGWVYVYNETGEMTNGISGSILKTPTSQYALHLKPVADAPVPTCVISVVLDEEELVSITAASRVRGERNG